MAGTRQSFVFALEDEFGKGKGAANSWIAPPVGSFFNNTHSRQATKIYTVGSKFFDTVAYGQLNGSFNWTFVFDYYYLEPLQLAFEKVGCTLDPDGIHYIHTFEKVNNMRIPSFTVRRKILNRMAGGPDDSDEITELRGCVVRNVSFSKASGTSQLQVTFTGFYADERMYKGDLDATDYKEYEGKLSEYMCMFIGPVGKNYYVANTESLEMSLENNSDAIYNTCSPFAGLYYEGRTNATFGTTCYSNNPSNYKQRVYSGGYRNDVFKPMAKGMKPIPLVTLAAYDKSIRDDEYTDEMDFSQALADSDESMVVELTDVVIKSLTWPKGNDQKIQDTISSAECKNMKITITNTTNDSLFDNTNVDMVYDPKNVVQSYGYGVIFNDPDGNTPSPMAVITISDTANPSIQRLPNTMPTVTSTTGGVLDGWWSTPANAANVVEGTKYIGGEQIFNNLTLFARWVHTVTFDPGEDGHLNLPAGQAGPTADLNTSVQTSRLVNSDITALAPSGSGKSFAGWYLNEATLPYDFSQFIKSNFTLYAHWEDAETVEVTFDKNATDATGAMSTQYVVTGVSTPIAANRFAYEGYTFVGWATSSSGNVEYDDMESVTFSENTTLYAKWTQVNQTP